MRERAKLNTISFKKSDEQKLRENFSTILDDLLSVGPITTRDKKGKAITAKELAEKIAVSESIISGYRNSKNIPSTTNLIKIAKFFNVSIDYLIGESAARYKENYDTANITGLSDGAIDTLKNCNIACPGILSKILECKNFEKIIRGIFSINVQIYLYDEYVNETARQLKNTNDSGFFKIVNELAYTNDTEAEKTNMFYSDAYKTISAKKYIDFIHYELSQKFELVLLELLDSKEFKFEQDIFSRLIELIVTDNDSKVSAKNLALLMKSSMRNSK